MRYRRFENWSLRAEQHRPAHYEIVRRLMVVDGWCRLRLELVPADRGWRRLVLDGRGHVGRHVAADFSLRCSLTRSVRTELVLQEGEFLACWPMHYACEQDVWTSPITFPPGQLVSGGPAESCRLAAGPLATVGNRLICRAVRRKVPRFAGRE